MDKIKLEEIFRQIEDPELHIDIWTLGLIYDTKIIDKVVKVLMTFTSPFCPFGPELVEEIKEKIASAGYTADVEVTFEPAWQPSEELRLMLGV